MVKTSGIVRIVCLIVLQFGTAFSLTAEELPEGVEYPEQIAGVTSVNAEGLIESITQHEDMFIVDARAAMDRKQGYIEGSVSLPDTETDCDSLNVLVPNLHRPLLFYCNGPKCGRSVKSINKAKVCGYTNLYWFRGGYEEWTAKGYPTLKE